MKFKRKEVKNHDMIIMISKGDPFQGSIYFTPCNYGASGTEILKAKHLEN